MRRTLVAHRTSHLVHPNCYARMFSTTRALLQAAATRPAPYRRAAAASSTSPTSARAATSSPAAAAARTTATAPSYASIQASQQAFDPFSNSADVELSRVTPLAPAPPLPSTSASNASSTPKPRRTTVAAAVDRSPLAEFGKPPFPASYADQLAQAQLAEAEGPVASGSGIDWTTAWNGLGTAIISPDQAQSLMRPLTAEEIQIKPGALHARGLVADYKGDPPSDPIRN